jgi:hypothetical protein
MNEHMNERIEGFAEQAKVMAEEILNKKISFNPELYVFSEKFTELMLARVFDIIDCHHVLANKPNEHSMVDHIKKSIRIDFAVE